MSIKEQQKNPEPTSLSDKELQDARQVVNTLVMAWKNYGLYPEDHATTIRSFENLAAVFDNFLTTHGDLHLTVDKGHLLCRSETIYEVSQEAPSEDIITLLYRDGIKWIEFHPGLTTEEITSFFKIAYKYRLFLEEAEGDIVTALFDEELEHIDFKAVDIFWQDLLIMDLSQLPPPAPQSEEEVEQNKPDQPPEGSLPPTIQARSIADPSIDISLLTLDKKEHENLRQMIKKEENWDISDDLFELLLIILRSQSEKEKFAAVLKFIPEMVVESIENEKFELLVGLFQSLDKIFSAGASAGHDAQGPATGAIFEVMSTPEIFQLISNKLMQLQTDEPEDLKALGQLLHYFSPEIIPFLVPVIIEKTSPEMQKVLFRVIIRLSRRDIGPFDKVAETQGGELGEELLVILDHLHGDRANEILFKMKDHSSDKVRRKAIKMLLDRDPRYTEKLFSLIDDPSEIVRTHILMAISKERSDRLEKMLLDYLHENRPSDDLEHILACYKALGRCGSDTSVPFLQKNLLERGWKSLMGSGRSVLRESAAIALALLNTRLAKDVLLEASKSKSKSVKDAVERSTAVTAHGEKPNG